MKNQYTADINDFFKYGLIRMLSGAGKMPIGVFWMLTSDDGGKDGNRIKYLEEPKKWRFYDPFLFDKLHEIVHLQKERKVGHIQNANILPGARFVDDLIFFNRTSLLFPCSPTKTLCFFS